MRAVGRHSASGTAIGSGPRNGNSNANQKTSTLWLSGQRSGTLTLVLWFYGTVLGMKEVPRPRPFIFDGAWFRSGEDELHLIIERDTTAPAGFRDAGPAKYTGLATHIAFEVTALAAMKARLEGHGIEILGGPIARGDGVEQFYFYDPDGYML